MKISLVFPFLCLAFRFIGTSTSLPLPYDSIFNFGDSVSDTGNAFLAGASIYPPMAHPPYGETFFRKPTGRNCDGRLIIDFLAEESGLPYLSPYRGLKNGMSFKQGVNFAVVGATALDRKYFDEHKIKVFSDNTMGIQLDWFKKFKSSVCTTKRACNSYFRKSLFVVGEIGGNDYNFQFAAGRPFEQIRATVPVVVEAIINATEVLIENGAVELMIPGSFPVGCLAVYLSLFKSPNKADYDHRGCLETYNAFLRYHDYQLQRELNILRKKYPHTRIIYADHYGATMRIFDSPQDGNFQEVHKACCGTGGEYNYNLMKPCGGNGTILCTNPSRYAIWDGIHLTEAGNRYVTDGLVKGRFTTPSLDASLTVTEPENATVIDTKPNAVAPVANPKNATAIGSEPKAAAPVAEPKNATAIDTKPTAAPPVAEQNNSIIDTNPKKSSIVTGHKNASVVSNSITLKPHYLILCLIILKLLICLDF